MGNWSGTLSNLLEREHPIRCFGFVHSVAVEILESPSRVTVLCIGFGESHPECIISANFRCFLFLRRSKATFVYGISRQATKRRELALWTSSVLLAEPSSGDCQDGIVGIYPPGSEASYLVFLSSEPSSASRSLPNPTAGRALLDAL